MATYSGPGHVKYRGVPVLQSGSVELDAQTDNKDVNTLLLGRAGHSRGARKVQIQVESAIPQTGMEIDWVGIANAQTEIPLSFTIANKTWNCVGDVRDTRIRSTVNDANSVSFTFHGRIVSEI